MSVGGGELKRLPGLKATYGKGLGAYAAKAEAAPGGRPEEGLGVVAAPASRSATARLADGRWRCRRDETV